MGAKEWAFRMPRLRPCNRMSCAGSSGELTGVLDFRRRGDYGPPNPTGPGGSRPLHRQSDGGEREATRVGAVPTQVEP